MPNRIQDFVDQTGIVYVNEHHIPDILLNPEVNLLQLFQQSYAGWTQARPYPLPSEKRDGDPMLTGVPPTNWEALDASVKAHHQRADWCPEVLRRAGVERVITDPYTDPMLDARLALGTN